MMKKYSIIVPTRNAGNYVKDCIQTVIAQEYDDYELIVSDNHSEDETNNYVKHLNHPKIRLIKPEKPLSMVEHWEWALKAANGEWIMFLGSDDGLMPYFFNLCDFLTSEAQKNDLLVINSIRAYFFWKGCESIYGNTAISYSGKCGYSIKKTKYNLLNATIGIKNYVDLPQMYTESIVHKSVIEKVYNANNGKFYSSMNPDSNGAANICLFEDKYVESLLPLAFVGTSPASNGYQARITTAKEYLNRKIFFESMNITWHPLVGNPFIDGIFDKSKTIHNLKICLFESLLQTEKGTGKKWLTNSTIFKILFFANVLKEIQEKDEEINVLKDISKVNRIPFILVVFLKKTLLKMLRCFFWSGDILFRIKSKKLYKIRLSRTHSADDICLMDAYNMIQELNVPLDLKEML